MFEEEATSSYKKKLINTIVFGIVAELIYVLYDLLNYYYG